MDTQRVTAAVDRATARVGPAVLRWTVAVLWLGNLAWKRPPNFGSSGGSCSGYCRFLADGYQHPVFPGSGWLFREVITAHIGAFGWFTVVAELTLAALLLSGRFVRTAALTGVALSFGIMAAVANAPGEWYWTYFLMIAMHLAVLVTAPAARPQRASTFAGVVVAFGAVMTLVHIGEGLTGTAFTVFNGSTPLPNDLARNLFGGSVALGLIMVVVGLVGLLAARLPAQQGRVVGLVALVAGVVVAATYSDDGTLIGLGATTSTACILVALGLALSVTPEPAAGPVI